MRVLVTGAAGSGRTTLGRALCAELNVAFFDVDEYFWLPTEPPYQHTRQRSDRLSLLAADLAGVPYSVTSGSVINWGRELEDSFSLIVFLTLQAELRLARLREREVARFGQVNPEFLAWAAQYDEGRIDINSRFGDEKWLAKRACPVLRIDGDVELREKLGRVTAALSELKLLPAAADIGSSGIEP